MSRRSRLKTLFDRWRTETRANLITDGIVDEEVWDRVSPRILYLMKEANSPGDKGGWSLCDDFLAKGAVMANGQAYPCSARGASLQRAGGRDSRRRAPAPRRDGH